MEENLYKLGRLSIQDNLVSQFYVVKRNTILTRLKGICDHNIGKVESGMLLQGIAVEGNDSLRVRVCKTKDEKWYRTEWKCFREDVITVSPIIWHHLCSVSSLQERTRLVNNKQLCKDVENIKISSNVWFCPDCNNPKPYLANVEYIGPVPELGDGYYFGLDTLDKLCIYQPCQFIHKYFIPRTSAGTFTTISSINPRKSKAYDGIENFEKNFLSNDITKCKETDNFFINKKKEINSSREYIDNLQANKYSSIIDTDNNNQIMRPEKHCVSITTIEPIRNISYEQKNDYKSIYKNLKCFDPLNSDDEGDKEPKSIQQTPYINNLNIGSCVKVLVDNKAHYGVVRWIGSPEKSNTNKLMAAIELDNFHPSATDGTYQNVRYFQCSPQKAWFTDVKDCQQYDMAASMSYYKPEFQDFEYIQSLVVNGVVPPISVVNGDLDEICRKNRGIQGHHNSCYLDTTLFSMFAFTSVFDNILIRPPNEKDCPEYEEVQRVLREEIVNPLRKDLFVGADRVMKLRTLLEKSSSISGLTCEEKDPEEFLTSLIAQTLKTEPFLMLSSGQDAYHYQLFVEKDEKLVLPTVQQLLEQSFLTSDIKLKKVPSCFIIQMPRFGKSFKMYPKIHPTLLLDVTDIIEDSPRQCTVCGNLAKFECKECYGQRGEGLESTAFCKECLDKAHNHEKRSNHKPKTLVLPTEYEMKEHGPVRRLYLELLAVVCIETSHYVSFVKCAPGADAPWCFFDSMADRKGEQNGYNIPEMVVCPNFPYLLSKEGADYLSTVTDDRTLPEHAKRLLCDGYMCMYQSPNATMYKYKQ